MCLYACVCISSVLGSLTLRGRSCGVTLTHSHVFSQTESTTLTGHLGGRAIGRGRREEGRVGREVERLEHPVFGRVSNTAVGRSNCTNVFWPEVEGHLCL